MTCFTCIYICRFRLLNCIHFGFILLHCCNCNYLLKWDCFEPHAQIQIPPVIKWIESLSLGTKQTVVFFFLWIPINVRQDFWTLIAVLFHVMLLTAVVSETLLVLIQRISITQWECKKERDGIYFQINNLIVPLKHLGSLGILYRTWSRLEKNIDNNFFSNHLFSDG